MRSTRRPGSPWLALALASQAACASPDRSAGLYVEHPGLLGADLVAIHHATFSDRRPSYRISAELLSAGGLAVAHLEYPTSGPRNREIDDIIEEHAAFVQRYLVEHPEVFVTFVGFSQGGCVELDLLVRLARRDPDLLDRSRALLLAPARAVKFGKSTAVARRMIARCEAAERELEAIATGEPDGPVARLLGERTYLAWSCNDAIVGHDSFTSLTARIPAERVLYHETLGHLPWATRSQRAAAGAQAPYGDEVPLASALTRAIAEGLDPRAALAVYGEFVDACE